MASQAWKAHERRIATKLGGQRLGATGVSNADVETAQFCVEAKHRQSLPVWLSTALVKVRAHAKKQGKTGVVVLHESGRHDSLVLLSLTDFERLIREDLIRVVDCAEQEHN